MSNKRKWYSLTTQHKLLSLTGKQVCSTRLLEFEGCSFCSWKYSKPTLVWMSNSVFCVSGSAMTGLRPHLLNEQGSDDNFSDDETSPLTHDLYGGR